MAGKYVSAPFKTIVQSHSYGVIVPKPLVDKPLNSIVSLNNHRLEHPPSFEAEFAWQVKPFRELVVDVRLMFG